MQPLSPEVRAALKRAHPGLTDQTIDRAEALLALRAQLDPEIDESRIRELDGERASLLAREMPRYAEIVRTIRPRPAADDPDRRGTIVVVKKTPPQDHGPRQTDHHDYKDKAK